MSQVQKTVDDYAKLITDNWRKCVQSILNTARYCAEAEQLFSGTKRADLLGKIDNYMKESTFSKLVKIGNSEHFEEERIIAHLPANYTIIYEVAQLTRAQLEEAIRERVLHSEANRVDIVAFRKGISGYSSDPPVYLAKLTPVAELEPSRVAELFEALESLASQYHLRVDKPVSAYGRAVAAYHEKIAEHVRKGAKAYIAQLKKNSCARNKDAWTYKPDEVAIDSNSDLEDVERVLKFVGASDEHERLERQAYTEIDPPIERRRKDLDQFVETQEVEAVVPPKRARR